MSEARRRWLLAGIGLASFALLELVEIAIETERVTLPDLLGDALLMLKGFVHKEIAALRGTTKATLRHQARIVYQKAGVEGRAAVCAFFLDDLLPSSEGVSGP